MDHETISNVIDTSDSNTRFVSPNCSSTPSVSLTNQKCEFLFWGSVLYFVKLKEIYEITKRLLYKPINTIHIVISTLIYYLLWYRNYIIGRLIKYVIDDSN